MAKVRHAVRESLADVPAGSLVLAACSGGADSLALSAALAFVAPRIGLSGGGVTVDHGLQAESAERASEVAAQLSEVGLDPVRAVRVRIPGPGNVEAAAREARYAALEGMAAELGAAVVLLGHTLDDQAETVLLGLARGSGTRSLAGMPPARGIFRRPLLGLRRSVTAAAAEQLLPWEDPHNSDRRFARVRVRLDALPALEAACGPGVAEALARTADQLRADSEFMENQASERTRGSPVRNVSYLAVQPEAIRFRLLRDAALDAGVPAGALTARHVAWLDALVMKWHGQRWVDLPGGVRALRRDGEVCFAGRASMPGDRRDRTEG